MSGCVYDSDTDTCAKPIADKQKEFDDVGKTCQLATDCSELVRIDGVAVELTCDADGSRRRLLNDAQAPAWPARRALAAALPAGCYKTDADVAPIDGCECHESCITCGYDDNPTLSTECLTCVDLDHVLTKEDGL